MAKSKPTPKSAKSAKRGDKSKPAPKRKPRDAKAGDAANKPAPNAKPKTSSRPDYGDYRKKQAEISRERSEEGRDIGEIPAAVNPERRAAGERSLIDFCLLYFPARFPWPFSDDHKAAAAKLERSGEVGGCFALAMPRGSGKTTIAEVDVIRDRQHVAGPPA